MSRGTWMVKPSSASTRSATSSCGPTCCGCTRSSRRSPRQPRWRSASRSSRGLAARSHRRLAGRAGRSDQSCRDGRVVTAECGGRRPGYVSDTGQLTSVGITCALCHSSVDDSFAPGIGRRLDGWANIDLNVGAIVALSPALDAATKAEFNAGAPASTIPATMRSTARTSWR